MIFGIQRTFHDDLTKKICRKLGFLIFLYADFENRLKKIGEIRVRRLIEQIVIASKRLQNLQIDLQAPFFV